MTGIVIDGVRLGTIAKFAGNKRSERWVAYSIHRISVSEANSAKFSTMHAAIDWLTSEHDRVKASEAASNG
ncbi:hypothetical protein NKH89_10185 [Mesorhizobium sp. M0923]|uniref:hypothetical protein n=1 Tax=unclassified Mesorhizobium TaxID=325217 RepID=UPI00333CDD55